MQITFHPFFISVNTVHNNKKSSFIHEEQEGFCECYQFFTLSKTKNEYPSCKQQYISYLCL